MKIKEWSYKSLFSKLGLPCFYSIISFLLLLLGKVDLVAQNSVQKTAIKIQKKIPKIVHKASSTSTPYQHYTPIHLPNGWSLSPIGKSYPLGDLPLNLVVSPRKHYLGIVNSGQSTQSIQLFSILKNKIVSEIPIPKTWYGLAFNIQEDKIFVSGANDNMIRIYSFKNEVLKMVDSLVLGKAWPFDKICPTGIALNESRNELYTVTKEDSSLYVFDLKSKKKINQIKLPSEAFSCMFFKNKVYLSLWGSKQIGIFDPESKSLIDLISVGDHPNDFTINKAGTLLYTANANDNTVSIVDLKSKTTIETLSTSLYPTLLSGSTPDGLALSENEKTLYIADADNNCISVFDISKPGNSISKGFIPTGWYPTQVKVIENTLYISNGKGLNSMANPHGPNPFKNRTKEKGQGSMGLKPHEVQYIGGLFKGTLSVIHIPKKIDLDTLTRWTYNNTPYSLDREFEAPGEENNPIPKKVGESTPIQYVFYIIKENRTYDQVLGDVKGGNGDTSLCLFPERITPNQHSLVKNYVLLDNFYVDAEVSADGHNWSTAAYANDFVEKTWPTSYGGRGGNYDFEGTRKIAFPKDGFIWDHLQKAGVSYRTYGEFAAYNTASIESLKDHTCPKYPGFDLSIKDSEKEKIWENDFDSLLALGKVPKFNSIRLGNDHTSGMRKGAYSILSAIGDNDLAVGQLIEHLSKSSIWNQSSVFILEDDAQAGSDHVDAHRSTAYLAGPYVKRSSVIHDPYTTSGMLRTIELILGIKPMSQYDAGAIPLFNCFSQIADPSPYRLIPENIDINVRNTAWNKDAQKSQKMDFSKEDEAPEQALNQIIWSAIKGEKSRMPPPKHSAFIFAKTVF